MKKVLVLSASPLDQEPLRLDEEARDLDEKLRLVSKPTVEVSVVNRWAVRTDQVQEAILNEKPNILHFSGHGGGGSLCFEDSAGYSTPVSATAIAELMRLNSDYIECLVLNACYSQEVAELSSVHLEAVVGCDGSIDDDAAVAFARSFYRAIADGRTYKVAFDWAVNEVRLNCSDA